MQSHLQLSTAFNALELSTGIFVGLLAVLRCGLSEGVNLLWLGSSALSLTVVSPAALLFRYTEWG